MRPARRPEFGAVPLLQVALAATNFAPLLANGRPAGPPKKGSSMSSCGCRPTREPGPWCPFRSARADGKQAAVLYGAAARGEPKARQTAARIGSRAKSGDRRAQIAAKKLDDAGRAREVAILARSGDPEARRKVEQVRAAAPASADAAEVDAMLEVFLALPEPELLAVDVMADQYDTSPDDWLFEAFSPAGMAAALIDTESYDWPL